MKKLMATLLAACLVISLIPFSAVAAYTIPDYAVSLEASEDRIYEGKTVDISININSEDFLMTDMSVGFETAYFENAQSTTGVVGFATPEIIDASLVDGDDNYKLQTQFTFEAKDVSDTVEVEFTIDAADIVYSYESANANEPTNVADREGVKVIIVKQYNVSFEEANGNVLFEQTVDKGLASANEDDTVITVPAVDYDALGYVEAGLVADYYEHVWTYNGTEYTDAEIAMFGQNGNTDEITEDTVFELVVREQTFDVTVPDDEFDTSVTPDTATYGTDYTGKIHPDEYDEKYIYTVKYEIDGVENQVDCTDDSFTIPGANITGDMVLSFEKELGIEIKAYEEYITGHFLITVRGGAAGYTFDSHEMFKSETHDGLRAWLYEAPIGTTVQEAEEYAESVIFVSDVDSPVSPAGCDINESKSMDLNDPALSHGAYMKALLPVEDWVKVYLTADVDKSYHVDTDDYSDVVEAYKAR